MGTEGKRHDQAEMVIAPFVAKTFHIVSDPSTDAVVRWGHGNNTFLVLDHAAFSDLLLPAYFKHRNFASFVRQLNTYGFRKVDPDRWEFAHESFLRGQTHLLPLIARKKKKGTGKVDGDEEGVDGTIQEVRRLRQEQRAMEEELQAMDRRLQATETRPQQMMSFLGKLADDPDLIRRVVLARRQEMDTAAHKKRRLVEPAPRPSPPRPRGSCASGGGACDTIGGLEPELGALDMELAQARAVPFPFSVLGHVFY